MVICKDNLKIIFSLLLPLQWRTKLIFILHIETMRKYVTQTAICDSTKLTLWLFSFTCQAI